MIRWLYNFVFPAAFAAMLPGYLRRMIRRGNFRQDFWQRFGFYRADLRARLEMGHSRPWLQAVSVGEMLVALKLVAALRERVPDLPLVLSTTTTTGYELARQRAPAGVDVVYTPVDLLGAVRRAFRTLRPSQLVIVDGGLWPNQLWEARRRKVPTALVNARLSLRSERRFRRFHRVSATMFRLLDFVAVPEKPDVERWQSLGVRGQSLHWTGSIKFDDANTASASNSAAPAFAEWRQLAGVASDAPILLAGSTHPGEEKILGMIYQRLRKDFPGLFLIVVPRHVERSSEVRAELEALELRVLTRTMLSSAAGRARSDVLLVNTTGELRDWYAQATVVFVGKSLTAVGGQNPAEAVAVGKPVVLGPHTENFAELVSALLAVGGAVQVNDAERLEAAVRLLLGDPERARQMACAGQRQLDAHRGAAGRTADLLLAGLKNSAC